MHSDFNSLATDYAQFRTGYSAALFREIASYARAPAPADVLDLACGTGLGMLPYLERGDRVTGVDVAAAMIARARQSLDGYEVRFRRGRAEALPFADASFDVVSCAQAFHWFDADLAFRQCARVLRPGGTLAIFWKHAARDDPYTLTAEAIIREWLGDAAAARSRDHAAEHEGFWAAFWRYVTPSHATSLAEASQPAALFGQGEKRTLSFMLPRSVESFVGYQRSREKIRTVLGEQRDEFFRELEKRLRVIAPAGARFQQKQIEYLFLARKP